MTAVPARPVAASIDGRAAAASDHTPIDGAAFRDAMRRTVAAVAIIAAGAPGTRRGMTATSICPLSDSPATILICVNRQASVFASIRQTHAFSVNFLDVRQTGLADLFAGRSAVVGEERFDDRLWCQATTGAPVLKRCLMALDCVLDEEYRHSTHGAFTGVVVSVTGISGQAGLLYGDRSFLTVVPAVT